uniref:Uncharacterized protein n=1 Tax=Tetranychus urticae TaxID=32264 RepID=T1KD76_TETUR
MSSRSSTSSISSSSRSSQPATITYRQSVRQQGVDYPADIPEILVKDGTKYSLINTSYYERIEFTMLGRNAANIPETTVQRRGVKTIDELKAEARARKE